MTQAIVPLNDLIPLIIEWGAQRGLHETTDLKPQLVKLTEELGEIAAGVARGDDERIHDGVGDLLVVLIQFGVIHGSLYRPKITTAYLENCLNLAWCEIHARTGETKDGVFVRDCNCNGEGCCSSSSQLG